MLFDFILEFLQVLHRKLEDGIPSGLNRPTKRYD